MDAYDPATVFSSIDHGGRYAYGNQPRIVHWNLARLGEALLPLFAAELEPAVEAGQRGPADVRRPLRGATGSPGCGPSSAWRAPTPAMRALADDLLDAAPRPGRRPHVGDALAVGRRRR